MARKAKRPAGAGEPPPKRSEEKSSDEMSEAWRERKRAEVTRLQAKCDAASESVGISQALLSGESTWMAQREDRERQLAEQLAKFPGLPKLSVQIAELQRTYGAAESEKAFAIREEGQAKVAYESLVGQGAAAVCGSCGQGVPGATLEQYLESAERRVMTSAGQVRTFDSRLSNIASNLHELMSGGGAEREAVEKSVEECRAAIVKCDLAIGVFSGIRTSMGEAVSRRDEAERSLAEVEKEENPFEGAS